MSDDVQKQLDDLLGQVDEKELADIKLGESKQIKKFNLDFLHKNEKDRLEKEDQTQDVFLSDKEEKENKTGEEPKTEIIQKKNKLLEADDKKINLQGGGKTSFSDNLKQRSLKDKVDGLYGESGLRPKDNKGNSLSGLNIVSEDKQEALESKIKEMEIKRRENKTKGAATNKGLSYINLRGLPIVPEALRMISEEEAREKKLICFMNRQRQDIRIAVLDYNEETEEIIERIKKENEKALVGVYLTSRASLDEALKTYAALPKIIKETDEIKVLEADIDSASEELGHLKDIQTKLKNVSTTGVFSLILAAAVKIEASDIHIESGEKRVEVRFRIDGVLHEVAELNKEQWSKLLSRVKLSAKLKINIKDKPQDGRFSIHIKGKAYDFRVSTLPISYGESVVMRILYQEKIKGMSLENLGLDEYNRQIIEEEIKKPNGLVVITGPTGAGKTTTLYATLNKLNTPDNKIITIEDPIEYKIENINQSEVKKDKDYTFAKALKSIIRQDPDIILVGEIRDR